MISVGLPLRYRPGQGRKSQIVPFGPFRLLRGSRKYPHGETVENLQLDHIIRRVVP
jgi:urease beta subunit